MYTTTEMSNNTVVDLHTTNKSSPHPAVLAHGELEYLFVFAPNGGIFYAIDAARERPRGHQEP